MTNAKNINGAITKYLYDQEDTKSLNLDDSFFANKSRERLWETEMDGL